MSNLFNNLVKLGNNNPELRDDISPILHHLKRGKNSSRTDKKGGRSLFKEVIDRSEIRDLRNDLETKQLKDKLSDIEMEFSERLSLDRDTEAAFNRFKQLLRSSGTSQANQANQLRKIADELGLKF